MRVVGEEGINTKSKVVQTAIQNKRKKNAENYENARK